MSNPLSVSPRGDEGGRPPQSPCLGGGNVRLLSVSPRGEGGETPSRSPRGEMMVGDPLSPPV